MYIDHISLLDYRTYALLSLPLSAGVTVFLGSNGVGKTNIVEAIDYAASLSSHRVSHDGPLVRAGASRAYIPVSYTHLDVYKRQALRGPYRGGSTESRGLHGYAYADGSRAS